MCLCLCFPPKSCVFRLLNEVMNNVGIRTGDKVIQGRAIWIAHRGCGDEVPLARADADPKKFCIISI